MNVLETAIVELEKHFNRKKFLVKGPAFSPINYTIRENEIMFEKKIHWQGKQKRWFVDDIFLFIILDDFQVDFTTFKGIRFECKDVKWFNDYKYRFYDVNRPLKVLNTLDELFDFVKEHFEQVEKCFHTWKMNRIQQCLFVLFE